MVTPMCNRLLGYVTRVRPLVVAALVLAASAILTAATKGPDSAGYKGTDETAFSFIDVAASGGASILVGTDDGTAALTLPFAFEFYRTQYTMVCVSSNGAVYFVANETACGTISDFANTDLTSTAPPGDHPGLFPFWTDLSFDTPGAGVAYQVLGDTGSRRFVIQWNGAHPVGSASAVAFEAILFEGSNQILFQYKTVDLGAGDPASKGGQATIGIRNADGQNHDEEIAWSHNAPIVGNETAILFTGTRAAPTITATGGTFTYNGSAHAGTGAAYGAGGASEPLPVTLSYVGIGATSYGPTALAPANAGTYNFTTTFAGDGSYTPASATDALTINKAAQTTTVTVTAPGAVTYGAPATATAIGGDAGTYSFSTGGSTGCSVVGDQVSVIDATGSCALTATRSGDDNYQPSNPSATFPVSLNKAAQSIAFTTTAPSSPIVGGTYTVGATGGGSGNAVVFSSLTGTTCSVAGTLVSFLATGTCDVAANQSGNNNYAAALQQTQSMTVGAAPAGAATTTSVTSSKNPSLVGASVTFTATVLRASNNTAVTIGTVTFKDGATVLAANVAVNRKGVASLKTSALTAGSHTITAVYNANATFDTSQASVVQAVQRSTVTNVVSSPNPSAPGQNVAFTATVTSSGTPVTAGTVTFMEGTTVLAGPIALDGSGQASFATSSLTAGRHKIAANYSPAGVYQASADTVTQSVK
jgi:hypothetical protein